MSRWPSVLTICIALALSGCAHQKSIGYGIAAFGGLGVVTGGLGGIGCASSSSQCKSGDVAYIAALALGGATLGGIGLAVVAAAPKQTADPDPPTAQTKPADPNAPDPNDAPRREEDVHFGAEAPVPGE